MGFDVLQIIVPIFYGAYSFSKWRERAQTRQFRGWCQDTGRGNVINENTEN